MGRVSAHVVSGMAPDARTCHDVPGHAPEVAGRGGTPTCPERPHFLRTDSAKSPGCESGQVTPRAPRMRTGVLGVHRIPTSPRCTPGAPGAPREPEGRPLRPHSRTAAQAHARSGTGAPEAHVCPPRPEPKPRMPAGAQDRPTEVGFHPSPHGAVPGTARPGCPEVPGHGMPALPCPGRGTVPQVPMGRPRTRCRGPAGRDASRAPCRAVARAAARVPQRRIAPSSGIPRRIRVPPPHLVSHECPGPCGTSG